MGRPSSTLMRAANSRWVSFARLRPSAMSSPNVFMPRATTGFYRAECTSAIISAGTCQRGAAITTEEPL